jgi:hypothetical protein
MQRDLQERGLQVELIPSNDYDLAIRGACVRVVVSKNPGWYRALFAAYPRNRSIRSVPGSRRHLRGDKYVDSVIDRKRIVQALHGLLNGGTRSIYAEDLLMIATERTAPVKTELDEVPF